MGNRPICPECGSQRTYDCPGGTCLNSTDPRIKYLCEDCLNEFGGKPLQAHVIATQSYKIQMSQA